MIVVTGATGHLGRHVMESLLQSVPAEQLVAAVRNPAKAADLESRGVQIRLADYDRPETLDSAFAGADKLLLISANEVGRRLPQHRAVIDAAKRAGVKLLAYTSILKADTSRLGLAKEHLATEQLIRESGIPFVFLRNGWYFENYTEHLEPAIANGAIVSSAGDGRISAASRADYAAAAAKVLAETGHENAIYELAGDFAFSLPELADEMSKASGKRVVYTDLTEAAHRAVLESAGLPPAIASTYADADQGVKRGELRDDSGTLRRLIGHPTTTLHDAVTSAFAR